MIRALSQGRPVPISGAGLFSFLFLLLAIFGCEPREGPATDPGLEGARALGLRSGALLHRVVLGGRGAEEHVLPQRLQVHPGDAVEFVTVDHRIHTVEFPRDSLSAESFDFLHAGGRDLSPPLPARGSRFVIRLEGAPLGRYPFFSHGHGGLAYGVIEVLPDSIP